MAFENSNDQLRMRHGYTLFDPTREDNFYLQAFESLHSFGHIEPWSRYEPDAKDMTQASKTLLAPRLSIHVTGLDSC